MGDCYVFMEILEAEKTTFTKGVAQALGIDKFSIKSPTYTYIRNYDNIYHIDLYRLEELDELLWQEIEEIISDKNNIVIIEWADKIKQELPQNKIEVHFKYIDANTREIESN